MARRGSPPLALPAAIDNGDPTLTDGLLRVRYLSGLRYPVLASSGPGANATRSGSDIDFYIHTLVPFSKPAQ